ncbi:M23 family metallopeptidase [Treponema sp.]|uniref:M23 family metallopeptidase n=1 Tax=Treponema sp. TaxID=166 RepID=UPI00388DF725
MKKHILFLFLTFLAVQSFSSSKKFNFPDYSLTALYAESVQPGDAVFIRLIFETKDKKLIKSLKEDFSESGKLEVLKINEDGSESEKSITKSDFYKMNREKSKKLIKSTLLTGSPLSSWVKAGEYKAKIICQSFGKEEITIELPVKIVPKEFISETIPLNASNTAIKTNTSSARMDQINRLNKILDTKNFDAVYETSAFIPPTPATRRTSFFADRRVYAYSNGKSSTSLHYGIDYGIPTGNEVRSCGKGKVVMAEDRISTGWSVCIEHLPGLYSLYYHMSELKVENGQVINAGDLIGLSGATGLATGPHLHWEVRLNMEAVSPDFFVNDFTFEKEQY